MLQLNPSLRRTLIDSTGNQSTVCQLMPCVLSRWGIHLKDEQSAIFGQQVRRIPTGRTLETAKVNWTEAWDVCVVVSLPHVFVRMWALIGNLHIAVGWPVESPKWRRINYPILMQFQNWLATWLREYRIAQQQKRFHRVNGNFSDCQYFTKLRWCTLGDDWV